MTSGTLGQSMLFQLAKILILTLLPATIISLLDQPHFFATVRECVLLRICHVTWNGSDHSRSPLLLQCILWYEMSF